MFDLEKRRSRSTTFTVASHDGEYQPLYKLYDDFFAIALTVSEILMFKICDLENLDQGHEGEKLDLRRSNANIILHFCVSSYRFRDINILNF